MSGFGRWQTKFLNWDHRHVSRQASYLVRVGRRHEAYFSFHAVTEISKILNASAVVIMSIDKGIKQAITTIPYSRLRRKTGVIKSRRR